MALASTAASALQAAGFVGTWDTDVRAGRSVLDSGAASLMAGDPGLAGTPLPLDAALGRIHPADRDWVFGRIHRVRRTGGPVSLEFRVVTGTGETRWILNRGCVTPASDGVLHGRGAYIDVTDLHRHATRAAAIDGASNGARNGATDEAMNGTMNGADLNAAADHGIQIHAALERHGDPYLRAVSQMLLLGIGRALARREF
ncbi:diguanylate cyclase [Methylobacterium radiotolerans]|uniref:PAS domain-containing protein n=1 Tax=Methylobacterium TaxID=407 RepID=UPI002F2C94EE